MKVEKISPDIVDMKKLFFSKIVKSIQSMISFNLKLKEEELFTEQGIDLGFPDFEERLLNKVINDLTVY